MRLKVIACGIVRMEIKALLAEVGGPGAEHEIEVKLLDVGLHDKPEKLCEEVQAAIEATEASFDYLLLGYGICSNGLAGITARDVPLVIPHAHDCITFFLGSKERYAEEFTQQPGTYYYTCGWIEDKEGYQEQEESMLRSRQEAARQARFEEYVQKYGEDNAQYLIEVEASWHQHYDRAAFINEGVGDIAAYRRFTRELAESRGWQYVELAGSDQLLRALLSGPWPEEDFLIVPPGRQTAECYDGGILGLSTSSAGSQVGAAQDRPSPQLV